MKRRSALIFLFAIGFLQAEDLRSVSVTTIDGEDTTLESYAGDVLLIVNVASKCGYTRQYDGLEDLYREYKDRGLTVLGFPCNQFGGQEPGSNEEIAEFCRLNFGVTFPLFDKIQVNGPERHPLYTALAGAESPFPGEIGWNFTKFLVDRDGRILARFASGVEPNAPELVAAVEAALADG